MVSRDLVRRASTEVGRQLTDELSERGAGADVDGAAEQARGRELIRAWLVRHRQVALERGAVRLTPEEEEELARGVQDRLFGLAGVQPLLDDQRLDNIMLFGAEEAWVDHADLGMVQVPPVVDSEEELIALVHRIAAREGLTEHRFDAACPTLRVTLRDGSRLHAVMGVCRVPTVTIRRHRLLDVSLDELVETYRLLTWEQHDLFEAALRARKTIVVCGSPGSGKSTLVRAARFPTTWRIVTIEENAELHWDRMRPLVTAFEVRHPNLQGEGGIGMRQLVRESLQMRPNILVVGEVLGDEVTPMLLAAMSGTAGTLCTLHAVSPQGGLRRLILLLAGSPEKLGEEEAAMTVAQAVDLVFHIDTVVDRDTGRHLHRWVDSVVEVRGVHRGEAGVGVATNELMHVDEHGHQEFPAPMSEELRRSLSKLGYDPGVHRWRPRVV